MHADLVMGIFDKTSYGFLLFALPAMILVSWLFLSKENKKHYFFNCCLHLFGNALNQPLNHRIVPKELTGQAFIMVFSIYNYVLCLMYSSVIISLLVSGSKPPKINSLEDLKRKRNEHLHIIMEKKIIHSKFVEKCKHAQWS